MLQFKRLSLALGLALCLALTCFAQVAIGQTPQKTAEPEPPEVKQTPKRVVDNKLARKTWTVGNEKRIALLHIPQRADKEAVPVVFAFHGHGGNSRQASISFRMHTLWPEAIVVYMEGLPTPGQLTDPEGKRNGWQGRQGLQGDRDLKFFDAVLESLKKDYKVDENRIYSMGHSNGGGFTYLLWKMRGDVFAAVAPSGAFSMQVKSFDPKPAMHIAGKKDELVKFSYQERMIEAVKKLNGCDEKGSEWAKDCTLYTSKSGTPLVTLVYDGSHKFPKEAPALIVKFFKEHVKVDAKKPETTLETEPEKKTAK